ncbi:DUF664 domain-containing protein [Micromonospora sp. M71_S20]|uniref:mycothiol transferase n=1 Tax=Micromonospora sp. M71_S20 TaxID=592872 RepID=UPI0018F4B723|nr:DUF664 domain-containing protein [Micromonospora sp. M71_S20]
MRCDGRSDEDPRRQSVPPSALSLLGPARQMAEAERAWFRRTVDGEDVPPVRSDSGDFQGRTTPAAPPAPGRPVTGTGAAQPAPGAGRVSRRCAAAARPARPGSSRPSTPSRARRGRSPR